MYPIHVLAAILAVTGTGMALPLEEPIAAVTSSPSVVEQPKESWADCDDPDDPEIPSKKEPFMFNPKKALRPKKSKDWCGIQKRDLAMDKRHLATDVTWVVDEDGFRTLSPESIAAIINAAPGPVVPESTPDAAASAAAEKNAGDKIASPTPGMYPITGAIVPKIFDWGPGVVASPASTIAPRKESMPESTSDAAASAAPEKNAGDKIVFPTPSIFPNPGVIEKIFDWGPGVVAPPANTTTSRKLVPTRLTKVTKKTKKPASTSPATATATGNSTATATGTPTAAATINSAAAATGTPTATATGTPTAADSSPTETPLADLIRDGPEIKMAMAMLTACSNPTNKTNAPQSPFEQFWSLFWKMAEFMPWVKNTKDDATLKCMIKAYNTWLEKMGTAEPTTPDDITEENASPVAIDCLPELSKAVQEHRDNGIVSPATVDDGGECIEEAYEDWMEDLRLSQKPAA